MESIDILPMGNGWLHRSAIGKLGRLLPPHEQLEEVFKKENIKDVKIKALGGRFLIITFKSIEVRDKAINEKWLMS